MQNPVSCFLPFSPHILHCSGSFRRKKTTCGDIDILITHKSKKSIDGILMKLVTALHEIGFMTDDLTQVKDRAQDKFMGML